MQRFFDLFFSTFALLILSPFFILIILILRMTGEGEIFFYQKRIGKNKKVFNLIKFATMLKDSENLGAGTITLKEDFRVLPFGKFLRKTKLNELPQLLNIFLGHMSVIGPRPLHSKQFYFYSEKDQELISSVVPGLSGLGSIIFRDEEKILQKSHDPDKTYKENITPIKAKLEKFYIRNRNIKMYFKLIILTIFAILFPRYNMRNFFKELESGQ